MNHSTLEPYVSLLVRVTRHEAQPWVAHCTRCRWMDAHPVAYQACDLGRVHAATHRAMT